MGSFKSAMEMAQMATPARNPAAGAQLIYLKSDGKLYTKNSAGVESVVNGVAGAGLLAAVGYRGPLSNQSIPNNTFTTLNLTATPDHDFGSGFTKASDVVTVVNSGVYLMSADAYMNISTTTSRVLLLIETWTGTDPGVGNANKVAYSEQMYNAVAYAGFSVATQMTLAAGAKVRAVVYQNAGAAALTIGSLYPHQLNLARIN